MAASKTGHPAKPRHIMPIAMLGAAAFALAACQEEKKIAAQAFPDEKSCLEAASDPNSWWTEAECREAFADAQATHKASAPRYSEQKLCEEEHAGACTVERRTDGSSVFLPLMAGYMMGNMMGNMTAGSSHQYHPQPIYKTKTGKYATASGSAILSSNRFAGNVRTAGFQRPVTTSSKPAMTRATVAKTGGFGAARASYSGGGRGSFGT